MHNQESQRRQYGLADRARQLDWTNIEIIDDDLGRSGGGIERPGFERMLAAIGKGGVGAVFAIEASRLSRSGRDWHTLIEFCGVVGTVLVDEDGLYDPRHPNDRLLLGMKGTMSGLELSLFRQRWQDALKQKARRGALFLRVAAGYVKAGRDRIEKDPDQRVQDAIKLVFSRFAECQSARQVHLSLREEGIELPAKGRNSEAVDVVWRLPRYNSVTGILTNPIYAGAYAFGRTGSKLTIEDGRKCIRRGIRHQMGDWDGLLKKHHEGYISREGFEHNQRIIANNGYRRASGMAMGAVRGGELLLAGLVRCGHCGRKLQVHYSKSHGRYNCYLARENHGTSRRISIGGLGIDAAVKTMAAQASQTSAAERQLGLALTQARYEAAHARRQYDAVDPANRLVASELARLMADRQIARLLNRLDKPTSSDNAWTQERVKGFRMHHEIGVFREGEWAERGEISLEATANIIGVCTVTALRRLRRRHQGPTGPPRRTVGHQSSGPRRIRGQTAAETAANTKRLAPDLRLSMT